MRANSGSELTLGTCVNLNLGLHFVNWETAFSLLKFLQTSQ